jgi:MFS family permease
MSKVIPLEYRGNYFGIRNFLASLATAGAGIIAGKIIQAYLYPNGYAISFFVAFIIHFIDLWILARTKEEPSPRVAAKSTIMAKIKNIPVYFREDKNFARYCYVRTLASFIVVGFPFYIIFAQQKLSLDPRSAAAAVGSFTFAQVASRAFGNLIWGKVSQRSGYKAPLEMACLIIGTVSVASAYINSYWGFIVALIIAGIGSAGFFLSSLNILMEFGKPYQRTTYIGISNAVVGLGGFIAPFLAGTVAQKYSFPAVFWMVGIISIITFFLFRFYVTDPRLIKEYRE